MSDETQARIPPELSREERLEQVQELLNGGFSVPQVSEQTGVLTT